MNVDRVRNEDWIKTLEWDLNVVSLTHLLDHLGVLGSPRRTQLRELYRFARLPVFEAAPRWLVDQIDEFLRDGGT